jgi:protein-S-isoprenylcysteine O-methyltransferase
MYHIANSLAFTEYLLVSYFRPSLKSFPYVSSFGKSYEFALGCSLLRILTSRRCHYGTCRTVPAISGHDQGRLQLLACSRFPKASRPPVGDRRCLRVGNLCTHLHPSLTGHNRWFRHPSYAGFFYWALGTQLVLQNPFSFLVYYVLLMRFFSSRIRGESSLF